jgi:hypothetical protein
VIADERGEFFVDRMRLIRRGVLTPVAEEDPPEETSGTVPPPEQSHHCRDHRQAADHRGLPVGAQPLNVNGFRLLVEWGGEIFRTGVIISLPIIGAAAPADFNGFTGGAYMTLPMSAVTTGAAGGKINPYLWGVGAKYVGTSMPIQAWAAYEAHHQMFGFGAITGTGAWQGAGGLRNLPGGALCRRAVASAVLAGVALGR